MKEFDMASWIWNDELNLVNTYVDFYDEFEAIDNNYILNISADSQYCIFINDKFVYAGQYPDYDFYKVYDRIDISEFVRIGNNRLKITAYCQGEDSSIYRAGSPGLIYSVMRGDECVAFSAKGTLCSPNPYYKSGYIDKLSPQLSFSFIFDNAAPDCYNKVQSTIINRSKELHLRGILPTVISSRSPSSVVAQGVFLNQQKCSELGGAIQYSFLSSRALSELAGVSAPLMLPHNEGVCFKSDEGDGIYIIIDLGQEDTGFFCLDVDCPTGTLIDIGFGEHLDDLRVRAHVGGRNFAAQYRCSGGRQKFVHYFKRLGLRYLQLHIHAHEFKLFYAGILPVYYPVSDIPYFYSSDHLHNKIYETCKRTLLLCMHEHYEDCPWREQALYNLDSYNQMRAGYYVFGEYDMPRECLRLIALSLRDDGLLELCSPARVGVTIPSFSLAFVMSLCDYLLYTNDISFVQEYLYVAEKIIDTFISRKAANGLVPRFLGERYWNFYEWAEGLDGSSVSRNETFDAPLNMYLSIALNAIENIYKIIGQSNKAKRSKELKEDLNKAIDKNYWSEEKQAYLTFISDERITHFAQLTQALAVCSGACPQSKTEAALNTMVTGGLIPITLSCHMFKYEALLKMPEKYSEYVFDDIARVWGKMLFNGATTFWETELGAWDFDNAGSLCHGWSAIPAYFYFAYALGLKPKADCRGFDVAPVNSGIAKISGRFLDKNKSVIELKSEK